MKKLSLRCLSAMSSQVGQSWQLAAIITDQGQPTRALLSLLELLDIQHDHTLESIVHATQRAWLRPADKERWELNEIYSPKVMEQLRPYFHPSCDLI